MTKSIHEAYIAVCRNEIDEERRRDAKLSRPVALFVDFFFLCVSMQRIRLNIALVGL